MTRGRNEGSVSDMEESRRRRSVGRWRVVARSLLNGAKYLRYFAVERSEVEIDDAAARMQDYINRAFERSDVAANGLAHAAFDAIPVDGLPHDLADGEPDARG